MECVKCTLIFMNPPFANETFYHVYNRGVEKRTIFKSSKDYLRFLETINFYRFYPSPRKLSTHIKFDFPPIPKHITQKQLVKIICFCLMPNHFHLLIQQLEEKGISEFMRRILDSFTRYFNVKYERVGPLLQGPFKAKLVDSDEYLLQLTKYIHRNPLKLPRWAGNLDEYTFSSYAGYLNKKRNYEFSEPEFVLEYFGNSRETSEDSYRSFVEETPDISAPDKLLIDDDY